MFLQKSLFSIFCVLAISSSTGASMLSWLTGGGNKDVPQVPLDVGFPSTNPIPISPYPEETGECAHWGNLIPPQYSTGDGLMYSSYGSPVPAATLIGSHKRVPVGSIVAVTNMKNGNTVSVRVVPPKTVPIAGRVMDLSPDAFSQVAVLSEGVFLCSVKVVDTPRPRQAEIHSLTSYSFDNEGGRNPGLPSSFVRGGVNQMGGLGDLEMLARNDNRY